MERENGMKVRFQKSQTKTLLLSVALMVLTCIPSRLFALENSLLVWSGMIGGIYGAGDALLHGKEPLKGMWDGALLSLQAPGFVVGGIVGMGTGATLHTLTLQPFEEKAAVGWFSAGAVTGGMVSMYLATDELGSRWFGDQTLLKVGRIGYAVTATLFAAEYKEKALKTLTSDKELHYTVSREIRNHFDPGEALKIGFAKEATDYFLGSGTPELRDLQNNWNGTFRL